MAKALSLDAIRSRAVSFVADWQDEPGEERQQAQSFVRDLLGVYGITKTKAAFYEKRARRSSTGGHGYIDALLPGLCLIEMKSAGADLVAAETQALDYIDSLPDAETPRWVITSDFHTFRVLDLEADRGTPADVFPLTDLPRRRLALAFLAGYQPRAFGTRQQEAASIKAARIMADLFETLETGGYGDHAASVFLVRLLFCLYADDAGVWERDHFMEYVDAHTSVDGADLGGALAHLFQVLDQPEATRQAHLDTMLRRFPYVNGDLFSEPMPIPAFDAGMREKLLAACSFNWSAISPAIFGSLFQAIKDKDARRALGEHYTTETNILKTINPLFMDELRAEYARVAHDVAGLKRLRKRLSRIRVLDPACGCGNFLIVAYRELRALDLDILSRLQELGDTSLLPALFFTKEYLAVTLDHFAGIEIEEWPARIASAALHLIDHQANQAMEVTLGKPLDPLPLETLTSIHVGNALRTAWTEVMAPGPDVVVVGNPPFNGARTMSPDQKKDITHVWGAKSGDLDYVTGWFKKAIDYFGYVPGRFAFVSTNSITQGLPVPRVFEPIFDRGWRIRFAHRTFAWTSEAPNAAAVHCVITGYDKTDKPRPVLYTYSEVRGTPTAAPATHINAYLVDGPNIFVHWRRDPLSPILPSTSAGSMANDGGNLIVEATDYDEVAADPVAAKYLRPFVMGRELLHGEQRWCLWLVDLDPKDVAKSRILSDRLTKVRDIRERSKRETTRVFALTPHLFGENHQPDTAYLGIPRVFSEQRYWAACARLTPDVIAGDKVYTCPDPDGFAFAIISSSMFITWQKTIGGRLKSDPSFSNTVVWNNLPLPAVDDRLREQIVTAGQGVLDARALRPERSLADHYNPLAMDPALLRAHAALDRVVDKAFKAPRTTASNDDRRAVLFARYTEMAPDR